MPIAPSAPPVTPLQVGGDDLDDLAEPEGHDGEVVAPQPERRGAEEHAGEHGRQHGERYGPERVQVERAGGPGAPRSSRPPE